MAVGDQVIADYQDFEIAGVSEPPLRGLSNSEAGNDVTVIWENGELTVFLNTFLRQVLDLPDAVRAVIGKYVQITAWPAVADGQTNKSPGASGLIVDAVAHGTFGSGVADQVDLFVATENGRQHMALRNVFDFNASDFNADAPFVIQNGRREV